MRRVGFGCMRLSTGAPADAARVLRAALDAGATLLDTADAYAAGERDIGHNERLIAEAGGAHLAATKGGLTRPGGRWLPNGKAKHLRAACEASLRALGVERIPLYQLHAVDPATPLATSVRALAKLREEGLVEEIGLCNVSATELRAALDLAPIRSVQIALSPLDEHAFRGGVPALCRERGILLIAHSPLGGPKRAGRWSRDLVLRPIADKHGVSAQAIVLAWLYALGAVPIPGATREETAREAVRAASIELDEEDRAALDARFPLGRLARERRELRPRGTREIVLVMGIPAAGKSTRAAPYAEHERFNRDERGGTLAKIARALDDALASGTERAVLDNTYATRALRDEVLEVAEKHGATVRCTWLDTPLHEAQINAVNRMLERYGRLLEPEEMKRAKDAGVFDPRAQLRYLRELEPPHEDEGFAAIERVPFARAPDPRHERAAVVVSLDAFVRLGATVAVDERRAEVLRALEEPVYATSWQPGCARDSVERVHDEVRAALGMDLPIVTCTHAAGPPICWCRKPLPGLALALIHTHRIDPARSRWVGTSIADRTLARNLGFTAIDAGAFFGDRAS